MTQYQNTHYVDLVLPPFLGANGYKYDVTHNGETIVTRSKSPVYDTARALSAKGLAGRIVLRTEGNNYISGLIATLATLTVSECNSHGPRFVRWSPHFMNSSEAEVTQ